MSGQVDRKLKDGWLTVHVNWLKGAWAVIVAYSKKKYNCWTDSRLWGFIFIFVEKLFLDSDCFKKNSWLVSQHGSCLTVFFLFTFLCHILFWGRVIINGFWAITAEHSVFHIGEQDFPDTSWQIAFRTDYCKYIVCVCSHVFFFLGGGVGHSFSTVRNKLWSAENSWLYLQNTWELFWSPKAGTASGTTNI